MRLWSLSPKYLDGKALGGLWNEALLARNCIACDYDLSINRYSNHSQLIRFKQHSDANILINYYLTEVYKESLKRGYKYNANRIDHTVVIPTKIEVNKVQILYEIGHLWNKLIQRKSFLQLEILHSDVRNESVELNNLFYQNNNFSM